MNRQSFPTRASSLASVGSALVALMVLLASIAHGQTSVKVGAVNLAQTHVLNADGDPEQLDLIGDRDVLFKANFLASETGVDPARIQATLTVTSADGQSMALPLQGPQNLPSLPTSFDNHPGTIEHSFDDSHTATIPAAWVKPGLRWELAWDLDDGGGNVLQTHILDSAPLAVRPPAKLIMSVIDVQWFEPETPFKDFPGDYFDEIEQKMPVSDLELRRVRQNVFPKVAMPYNGTHLPDIVESVAEWNATFGDGEVGRSNRWASVLQKAAGANYYEVSNFCVVNHGSVASGGLGSDGYFCSSQRNNGVFWHEFGHSFMLRHWGATSVYPYKDPDPNDGVPYDTYLGVSTGSRYNKTHVGPYWAFDARNGGTFISPRVDHNGVTRWKSSPMQGGGQVDRPAGLSLAHFSDYSINKINSILDTKLRWLDTDNEWLDDAYWAEHGPGWYFLNNSNGMGYLAWDGDGLGRPVERDFDVYSIMVAGSMATNGGAESFGLVYPPIGPYTSNVRTLFDPRDPADLQALNAGNTCPPGGCDLSLRITQTGDGFDDQLYVLEVSWDETMPYTDKSSFFEKALNVPANQGRVTQIELLLTPDVATAGLPATETVLATWRHDATDHRLSFVQAEQSSTDHNGGQPAAPTRAIDGNTDGTWAAGSIAATSDSSQNEDQWWEGDLGARQSVDRIDLWGRTDCCLPQSLRNFYILVTDADLGQQDQPVDLATALASANAYQHEPGQAGTRYTWETPAGTSGRYVMVYKPAGNGRLEIAEVLPFVGARQADELSSRQYFTAMSADPALTIDAVLQNINDNNEATSLSMSTAGEKWLMGDLGEQFSIDEIRLKDGLADLATQRYSLYVTNEKPAGPTTASLLDPLAVYRETRSQGLVDVSTTGPVFGRYIYLINQMTEQRTLAVSEMEVMVDTDDTPPPPPPGESYTVVNDEQVTRGYFGGGVPPSLLNDHPDFLKEFQCPTDSVMAGIDVYHDNSTIKGLGFSCATVNDNGTLGDTVALTGPTSFGDTSAIQESLTCPPNFITGLRGRGEGVLNKIGHICATIDGVGNGNPEWHNPAVGGDWGAYRESRCPAEYVVSGVELVNYYNGDNSVIDDLKLTCTKVTVQETDPGAQFDRQLAEEVAQTAAELCPDGIDDCDVGRFHNQFISLESMDVDIVGGFWKTLFGLRSVDPQPASCYDGNGNNVACFDSEGIPEDQTLFDEVADLATGSADTEHFAWGIYSYDHEYADFDGVGHQDTYESVLLLHPQDVFGQSSLVVIEMDDPTCWPTDSTDPWATLPDDCKLTIDPDNLPAATDGHYRNGRFKFGGYLYYLNDQVGAYFLNTCGRTYTNEQLVTLLDSDSTVELPTMHCGLTPEISNTLDLLLHQRTVDWIELTNLFAQAIWQVAGVGLGELSEVLAVLEEAGELTEQGLRLKNLVTALQAVEGTGGAIMNGMMLHDAIIAHGACAPDDQACRRQQVGAIMLSSLFLGLDVVRTGSLLNELRSVDSSIQFTEEEMTPLLGAVHDNYEAISGEPVGSGALQSKRPLSSGKLRSHVAEDPQGKPRVEHEDKPITNSDCN